MKFSKFTFEFDIHKAELVTRCDLRPTEVKKTDWPWLYAENNKYDRESLSSGKIGKWMLFPTKDEVNEVWDKIKSAVASGELWSSKVSTTDSSGRTHAIMVYTKDHTDLDDVINVLDYLESSGIKSPGGRPIHYKTDQQTRAGVYQGGSQKPWIYSSATVRGATVRSS